MNHKVTETIEIIMFIGGGVYLLGLGLIMEGAIQNGSELVIVDWKMPFETLFIVAVAVYCLSSAVYRTKRLITLKSELK